MKHLASHMARANPRLLDAWFLFSSLVVLVVFAVIYWVDGLFRTSDNK